MNRCRFLKGSIGAIIIISFMLFSISGYSYDPKLERCRMDCTDFDTNKLDKECFKNCLEFKYLTRSYLEKRCSSRCNELYQNTMPLGCVLWCLDQKEKKCHWEFSYYGAEPNDTPIKIPINCEYVDSSTKTVLGHQIIEYIWVKCKVCE